MGILWFCYDPRFVIPYNRQKARKRNRDDFPTVPFFFAHSPEQSEFYEYQKPPIMVPTIQTTSSKTIVNMV